jgi:hypothetical protein
MSFCERMVGYPEVMPTQSKLAGTHFMIGSSHEWLGDRSGCAKREPKT